MQQTVPIPWRAVAMPPSLPDRRHAARPFSQPDEPTMPLALTDVQLAVIRGLAEPLHPEDRDGYLRRIAELMHGREVGDGSISRAARTAQSEFLRPPILAT